jgi:hypothetical protein
MALVSEVKQQNGKSLQEFALRVEQMSVSVQLKEHRAKWILSNAISAQWKHDNPNLVVYLCNWESNPRLLFLDWRNDLKRVLHKEVVSRRWVVRHEQVDQDGHRRQRRDIQVAGTWKDNTVDLPVSNQRLRCEEQMALVRSRRERVEEQIVEQVRE